MANAQFSIREVLSVNQIIDGVEAIINGEFRIWRSRFLPTNKQFADYEFLLAAVEILREHTNNEDI